MTDVLHVRIVLEDGTPATSDDMCRAGVVKLDDGYLVGFTFVTRSAETSWRTPLAEEAIREAVAALDAMAGEAESMRTRFAEASAALRRGPAAEVTRVNRLPKPRPF